MLPLVGHDSRNLASMRGDGKCHIDAHEIHTCLYNMTITLRVKRSEQSYVLETMIQSEFKKKKKCARPLPVQAN